MDPKPADTKPIKILLEAGKKYAWCSCGLSASQPFCDGAHKGSGLTPYVFSPQQTAEVYLCLCKQTKKAPMCDGSHKSLRT